MNFSNLVEMIDFVKSTYKNPKALNFINNKTWHSFSTQEFADNIELLSLALKDIGLKKGNGFGITANPSPIWLMFNFATMSIRSVCVPIFANISTENLLFEIKDAKIEYFFCDNQENLKTLLKSKIKFKKIITVGFKNNENNENIIDFDDLIKIGLKIRKDYPNSYRNITKKIKEDDIATIIYTSGSTGIPKGVEITHKNLVTQIKGADANFELKHDEDIALSFLPLAHIFEGMVINFYISKGISVYFVNNVNDIGKLLKEVKPTLMTVVPRMLEKTYSKMVEKLEESGVFKKLIGKLAFKLALDTNPDLKKIPFYWFFNKVVYQKLTVALGGNLKIMICGGAPLSIELERFFNNIGINLYVGYGLTEASPVICTNSPKFHKIGTIGKKFPAVQIKIKNGELLTKGDCVMKGYHNDEEKTAKYIDKNGWLKTGDLVTIDEEGFVTISGRKKELFKTSGGKYVSPVPIEQQILQNCNFLIGALVIAEGKKFVSCLMFFDFDAIEFHKEKLGLKNLGDQEFLSSKIIQNKIQNSVNNVNKNLNKWEKIIKFELITDRISIENGDITPSMKLKRSALEKKYQKIIESFF